MRKSLGKVKAVIPYRMNSHHGIPFREVTDIVSIGRQIPR